MVKQFASMLFAFRLSVAAGQEALLQTLYQFNTENDIKVQKELLAIDIADPAEIANPAVELPHDFQPSTQWIADLPPGTKLMLSPPTVSLLQGADGKETMHQLNQLKMSSSAPLVGHQQQVLQLPAGAMLVLPAAGPAGPAGPSTDFSKLTTASFTVASSVPGYATTSGLQCLTDGSIEGYKNVADGCVIGHYLLEKDKWQGATITFTLDAPKKALRFVVYNNDEPSYAGARCVKKMKIQKSVEGGDQWEEEKEVTLMCRLHTDSPEATAMSTIDIESAKAYKFWRFKFVSIYGPDAGYAGLLEVKIKD